MSLALDEADEEHVAPLPSGPLGFVFDSGAGGLAIGRRLLPRLRLDRLGTQEARGIGGADSATLFMVAQLSVHVKKGF